MSRLLPITDILGGLAEFERSLIIVRTGEGRKCEKRPIKGGVQTIELVVERKPAFVGIDPYIKLISRDTSSNVIAIAIKPAG